MMNRIRNIKNRLSLSVDKLSPAARSRSPPTERKSCHFVFAPLSVGSIPSSIFPTPQRPQRSRSKPSRAPGDTRPLSCVESSSSADLTDQPRETVYMEDESFPDERQTRTETNANQSEFLNQSFDSFSGFSRVLSENDPPSLVEEVMKEVEKISTIPESIARRACPQENGHKGSLDDPEPTSRGDSKDDSFVSSKSDDTLLAVSPTSSSASLTQEKLQSIRPLGHSTISTASTLHADSVTSGYFSDSASEDITASEVKARQIRAKTASPIQKMFKKVKKEKVEREDVPQTASSSVSPAENVDKREPSKKESIYSRIVKSTKREPSSSRSSKEPLYARIKPKLKIESSFKPIEPIASKDRPKEDELLVKPEPIYSKLKPKEPVSSVSVPEHHLPSSPVTSFAAGNPSSPFTPVSPVSPDRELSKEPLYSSIKSKKDKTRTLPLEALYSKIRKKEAHTLPKDAASPAKVKEPIYNQPLPALPFDSQNSLKKSEFMSSSGSDSSYGRVVTVKAKEISAVSPSKPSVITIYNPGYAKTFSPVVLASPSSSSSPLAPSTTSPPVSPPLSLPAPTAISAEGEEATSSPKPSFTQSPTEETKSEVDESSISMDPGSKETLHMSQSTLELEDEVRMDLGSSSKLSRLVEELAQELETVTQRSGKSESKKEVLTRLLATYDVPRNLRRVEEADEEDVRLAEKCLLSSDLNNDELRYMDDDDNMETVYADVPDYSQDEFVIALDDENDPKYASLTRGMRRKGRGGESPGKVSRKSAQVYVNVINVISALKVLINSNSSKAATVINRMGTLARPYAHKVHNSVNPSSNWIQRKLYHKSGHNGFDELRKYIKSGGEFCKELAIIMHERAELEATYAKGLHKLSTKLVKASRDSLGTVSEAWQAVGAELEHEGDVHRILAATLTEEVVRPVRQLIETQHKIRKGVEGMVDKATKNLHDWKAAEMKAKKNCYHNTRENEKVQDMMLDARLGRGKSLSEKDLIKLEKQRRKAEEAVQKSDVEYYNYCVRTERARQEWESAVYKGSNCFQTLEEDRLASLKDLVVKYHKTNKEIAPKLVACAARLDEPVAACDVEKDIQTVILAKGTGENIPEQCLPDFYSEDLNNVMNKVRRREALEKFVKLIRTDLERERRGKQGVENLAKALQETPNFGGEESQQDVNDKLQNMKAMLAYLEAARFKVQSSLDEINNRPRSSHPLAKHIETHRDKQGLPVSILKVPPWVRGNSTDVSPLSESPTSGSPNWNDRGTADGNSVQPDSDFEPKDAAVAPINTPESETRVPNDSSPLPPVALPRGDAAPPARPRTFMHPVRYPSLILPTDEFSSQGSEPEYQSAVHNLGSQGRPHSLTAHEIVVSPAPNGDHVNSGTTTTTGGSLPDGTYYARPLPTAEALGRCKALYDYDANMYDELSIRTGDIINIHEKQADGWWVGEVEGAVGIFPATYVEEID